MSGGFNTLRFTPLKLRGADMIQMTGLAFRIAGQRLDARHAAVENPGGNCPGEETPDKIVDGKMETKWLDFKICPLVIHFPTPVQIDAFRICTGNDEPSRDPLQWLLEGSNDMEQWATLHSQTSDFPMPSERCVETEWIQCSSPVPAAEAPAKAGQAPAGSWAASARNVRINGHVLRAELSDAAGAWRPAVIIPQPGHTYGNQDGCFVVEGKARSVSAAAATAGLKVAAVDDTESADLWKEIGTVQVSGNSVSQVVVKCSWRDQDFGNTKGRLRVILNRDSLDIVEEDLFGTFGAKGRPGGFEDVERRFAEADPLVRKARKDDVYIFEYWVGAGGGHELHLRDFHVALEEDDKAGPLPAEEEDGASAADAAMKDAALRELRAREKLESTCPKAFRFEHLALSPSSTQAVQAGPTSGHGYVSDVTAAAACCDLLSAWSKPNSTSVDVESNWRLVDWGTWRKEFSGRLKLQGERHDRGVFLWAGQHKDLGEVIVKDFTWASFVRADGYFLEGLADPSSAVSRFCARWCPALVGLLIDGDKEPRVRGYIMKLWDVVETAEFEAKFGNGGTARAEMEDTICSTGMWHCDFKPWNVVKKGGAMSLIDLESIIPVWTFPLSTMSFCPDYCRDAACRAFHQVGSAAAAKMVSDLPTPFVYRHLFCPCVELETGSAEMSTLTAASMLACAAAAVGAVALRIKLTILDSGHLGLQTTKGMLCALNLPDGQWQVKEVPASEPICAAGAGRWLFLSCDGGGYALQHAPSGLWLARSRSGEMGLGSEGERSHFKIRRCDDL
eukprot:gb/GFBE01057300.1/.p1 GENE.gb/GFBE01057300.1/~~gb/GFBE01057300.1/.p1  ORF type:complete len:789 (+),score=152.75 gb/GFBE01057300.1/:1-2367(+)